MKLLKTVILLKLMILFSLNSFSQAKQLSLDMKNVSIRDVLIEIENMSEYYFMYDATRVDVMQNVSIHCTNLPVERVLDNIFEKTGIIFSINKRQIALSLDQRKQQYFQINPKVTGQVTTSSGDFLPGVSVAVKGLNIGTITDNNGNFELTNIPGNATLFFSFIGLKSKEVELNGESFITVSLDEESIGIAEVIAVGYGIQRKETVTGALSTITHNEITLSGQTNISNALSGKLPGIKTIQRSGEPGNDGSNVYIRGFGEPLVIVDGIERNYTQLDPNEIESLTILKDASAAVYGFKGANGVILVDTRKGSGETKITYNASYGFQTPTRHVDLTNAYEYATLRNEGIRNVGGTSNEFSDKQLEDFKHGYGTDWFSEVVENHAPKQYHNLNVSGESKKVNYFFSIGYVNQKSLLGDSQSFDRYNFRSNISAEINPGFTADFQIGGRYEFSKGSAFMGDGGNTVFRAIAMAPPIYSKYANDQIPKYQDIPGLRNPLAMIDSDVVGYYRNVWKGVQAQLQLKWEMPNIKGMTLKGLVAIDQGISKNRKFIDDWSTYNYNSITDDYDEVIKQPLGELNIDYTENLSPTFQFSTTYVRSFKEHRVNGLLLLEARKNQFESLNGFREFSITTIDQLDAGNTENKNNGGNQNYSAYVGLVGRINYDYKQKYLLELSGRYDGSFKFAPDHRWGLFPAISLGYIISEEDYFRNRFRKLDYLKFRASTGILGDESYSGAYQWASAWVYPNGTYIFGEDRIVNGISETNIPNPQITWYKVKTTNVGFDLSAWKGKLSAVVDFFYRRRDGLYGTRVLTLPSSFGATLPQENLNSDNTRGLELMLGTAFKVGNVDVSIKGNLTYTRAMDLHYERAIDGNDYLEWRNSLTNRNKYIKWGYVSLGQFKTYSEIFEAPVQDGQGNTSLLPGDIRYEDFNKDGVINEFDQRPIGREDVPDINGGLATGLRWKNYDFNLLFQGAGNYSYETFILKQPFLQGGIGNGLEPWMDRWHKEDYDNPDSEWIPGEFPAIRTSGYAGNQFPSTYWMSSAYYLRLKSVELGYNLSDTNLKRLGIQKLRVYINATNLYTITNVKYVDPEAPYTGLYYPQTKTLNIGFNLIL
ncbi:TonB-dependent receptor [Sunxiuqinia sp. A32]|uniref:TonB-dependent receptor n=1 Tax=Sunxiuqinia sp. A32 TaxID=3461496 RepID=UPI0040454642